MPLGVFPSLFSFNLGWAFISHGGDAHQAASICLGGMPRLRSCCLSPVEGAGRPDLNRGGEDDRDPNAGHGEDAR